MPELPEVETVCRGLAAQIEGSFIKEANTYIKKLRIDIPKKLCEKIQGKKITKVKRKAKYILIYLSDPKLPKTKSPKLKTQKQVLIVHLGMSGRLILYKEKRKKLKHDHMILKLDKDDSLVLNDPRRFGLVNLCDETELEGLKHFRTLGIEPFSKDFTSQRTFEIISKRNKSIKDTLMDSKLFVGIGNIYACEILFRSGVHPERSSSSINKDEAKKIHKFTVKVLDEAINAGGSTLRDYTKASGEIGGFQFNFKVYQREEKPCTKCKKPIKRIKQSNRSTFFCAQCQK